MSYFNDITEKSAFNEKMVSKLIQVVNCIFPYNINTKLVNKFEVDSGTVAVSSNKAVISSGAAANSYAILESHDILRYQAGIGACARFAGYFTTGVANNTQLIGVGNECDGFFFGYNGTSFGVLRRYGGEYETRTLTITTASSHSENITITLDGTGNTVAVTNTADATQTAREIAAHNYLSSGSYGWRAESAGNKVIFYSLGAVAQSGSYSLSGATSAVGAFAQTVAGVSATDTWVEQASWSEGLPSGMSFDQTKGNVYQIRYQWLGYGMVRFYIENPETGVLHLVHKIEYSNSATSPSVSNPTFPLFIQSKNGSNNTDVSISISSFGGFIEGELTNLGTHFSTSKLKTTGNTTSELPILTLRNKEIFQGKSNRKRVLITAIDIATALLGTAETALVRGYMHATPITSTSFADVDNSNSVVEIDSSSTAIYITGAELVFTISLSSTDSKIVYLNNIINYINPSESLLITTQTSKGNLSNDVCVSVNWKEL